MHRLNITAVFGHTAVDSRNRAFATIGGEPVIDFTSAAPVRHTYGYVYGNIRFPDNVMWTLGVSHDDLDDVEIQVRKTNPKFGVQWNLTDNLRLRAAVFRMVTPLLVTNRTLSPTQVAGFNQLFDDGFGDSSWRRGVALDWRIRHGLFAGAEASWRDLDHPFVDTELGEAVFVKHREQSHRVYAYWLAMPQLALSTQLVYDLFKAERSRLTVEGDVPERLRTVSVPLTARYFHETGFFAGFGATYVTQKVERSPDALLGLAEGSERFFVLDASLGYRLPFRRGIISLAVNNLLDRKFRFQDDSFRSFRDEPTIGPYIPSRAVVGRVTLNF